MVSEQMEQTSLHITTRSALVVMVLLPLNRRSCSLFSARQQP